MKNKTFSAHEHTMSGLFVFLLICLFAVTALLLTLTGVRVYRSVSEGAVANSDSQLALSYLRNKLRANDREGAVELAMRGGAQALCLSETVDGEVYETAIYLYGGYLCEQFYAQGDEFDPEMGQELIPLQNLSFDMLTPQSIEVSIVLPNGQDYAMQASLRTDQAR